MHDHHRLFFFLFAAIAVVFSPACGGADCGRDKEDFLAQFDELMSDVDAANLAVDDKQWKTYDERFRGLVEECYDQHEADLTGGEKRRFWVRAIGYYKHRYGTAALKNWLKRQRATVGEE